MKKIVLCVIIDNQLAMDKTMAQVINMQQAVILTDERQVHRCYKDH